ncbi:SDR family oxidoreductase [Mangrovihabitans endophyticus]|uniref:Dehydrogenase n=1 Tax=Mangrovihabitans endophyticus TaxID=1751298 RepID=A0A8J3BW05_9ACTN|nr:SDR family oxidoreductase [Mangrovihabitans endophyticus]GGK78344.1 dehydrogenase [Mangrovihabitans endophyticus]
MTEGIHIKRPVALVTGANKGIGRAVAEQLGELGMTVLVGSRDAARGTHAERELRDAGHDAHAIPLDVTDPASVTAAAATIKQRFGRLDVLVNNAGIAGDSNRLKPSEADLDLLREVFETNVFAVAAVTNAMLPLMRRSAAGRIVNMSSDVGSIGQMSDPEHHLFKIRAQAAYPTSKSALNALTVQYAKELRDAGILINAAAPGGCATDFTKGLPVTRTAAEGARIVVKLATLGRDGPTGGFFNDNGTVRW